MGDLNRINAHYLAELDALAEQHSAEMMGHAEFERRSRELLRDWAFEIFDARILNECVSGNVSPRLVLGYGVAAKVEKADESV